MALSITDSNPPDADAWAGLFRISRSGYATAMLNTTLSREELVNLGDITLGRGTIVHGRVVDTEGRGVGGATVCLADSLPDNHIDELSGPFEDPTDLTICDTDGNFRVEVAPGRKLRFWAKHTRTRFGSTEPLSFPAERDSFGVEIVVETWRVTDRVLGRVVGPTGKPVSGARVRCEHRITPNREVDITVEVCAGKDGHFGFVVQTEGPYRITASAPDGSLGDAGIDGVVPRNGPVLVQLTSKRFMHVSLQDQEDEPIERFGWRLVDPEGRTRTRSEVQEHPGGEARLALPSRPFRITVVAPGFAAATLGPFDPSNPPTDGLVFTLSTAPVLSGIALHANAPVVGANAVLLSAAKGRQTVNGFPTLVETVDEGRCITDGAGHFEFALPGAGRYYVRVTADGYAPLLLGPFECNPFHLLGPLRATMVRGGAIEGRVLTNFPRNAVGRIVGVNCGDGAPRTQRTGVNGRFRFEGLPPGLWQVALRDEEIDPLATVIHYLEGEPAAFTRTCTVTTGQTTNYIIEAFR